MSNDEEALRSPHSSGDLSHNARASMTLEDRHEVMNSLFGMKPFKSHVSKRRVEDRSPAVRQLYTVTPKKIEYNSTAVGVQIGNFLWALCFGWLLFLFYMLVAGLLRLSYIGRHYSDICWQLKDYFLWPFGKYLEKSYMPKGIPLSPKDDIVAENTRLIDGGSPSLNSVKPRNTGYIAWCIIAVPILAVVHVVMLGLCWMLVVFIPMAKVHIEVLKLLLFGDPLTLNVVREYPNPGAEILLYTNQAINIYYYKYTIGGMNVVLVNLLPFVLVSLVFGYGLEDIIPPIVIFVCSLLSTIPLSYYNGMAIASISAQTSFAVGALLTASFGSIIELILYVVSIKANLGEVARSAMSGALLGSLLFIPGLSMIIGGIKYKEQRFNPAVTGVSSVLLVIAVVGAFSPTLYYMLYGNYQLSCQSCIPNTTSGFECSHCREVQVDLDEDPVYIGEARTLMFICSGILPVAYLVGLLFTLKTHAHILHVKVEDDNEEEEAGEANPEWSKLQCIFVLLACTAMFAFISEKLVDTLQPVVESFGLTPGFLGVTVLAIIPSAAEYLNAAQFALNNNMSLAIEIGTSSAIQITLFQMPVMVVISAVINHMHSANSFTLIFPMLDFYAVFFSVLILNLIYQNGRTNYFIGSSLVIVYVIIISCFYFLP